MRRILIVGAGQSGLQLGIGLVDRGYDVTLVSARTPAQVRSGRILSTQIMFDGALRHERELGLNLWDGQAPAVDAVRFSVRTPEGERSLDWVGRFAHPPQSVDQRVKMPRWMEIFERRGGRLIQGTTSRDDLDPMVRDYDLVLVAAGRGELAELFERDEQWSPHSRPQRALAVSYVHGTTRCPDDPDLTLMRFNVVPGVGEFFVIPALTFGGPCEIPFFEGIPGGPLDCWDDDPGPVEQWSRMVELLGEHVPWEYERLKGAQLTDKHATLHGGVVPVVRRPVGEVRAGVVLGMADVVVANDPITGQGANNASRCAATYLESIVERGGAPFDREWMEETFARFWSYAKYTTLWSNSAVEPAPEHTTRIFDAATRHPEVADRFANGFDDPGDIVHWFLDPLVAEEYLHRVETAQRPEKS
jgi:2-polyprenyl-6-methoxyphenol hydroxylase-like FAD-dependent oxidoreductase